MIGEMLSRLRFFLKKRRSDIDEELQSHMEHAVASRVAGGIPEAEARRLAALEFGSMASAREQAFEQHPRAVADILLQDLRIAVRSLRRDRSFSITAVLILAIGIGANTAVFSLVNTLLLRPLPFDQPNQLVWLQPAAPGGGLSGSTYSSDAFDDLAAKNRSYSGVTGYFAFSSPNNLKLTDGPTPRPVTSIGVLPNFLDVLGIRPELGRGFRAEDGLEHAAPVVLLSHAFWKVHFRGDRSVVNRTMSINNKPASIIGVLPDSFDFGSTFSPGAQVAMLEPYSLDAGRNSGNILTLVGRLKPGVTPQEATNEAASLFPQLYWSKRYADSKGSYGPAVAVPLKEHVSGSLRRSLYLLWASVAVILLIVCVNVSNLLLGRASARSREFAMRFALGASRWRLIRQLLTEGCLLACSATLVGTALAFAVVTWLAHQGSVALPLLSEVRIDLLTLVWTACLAFATTLCFGLAPALRATADSDLQARLRDGGASLSGGRDRDLLRKVLITSEIALACVLTVGAGLLLRSFLHILDVDLGFRPTQVSTISAELPEVPDAQRGAYYRKLLDDIAKIPGVQSAGLSDNLPLARNRTWGAPGVKGVQYGRNERMPTFVYVISPGYLPTMGMHLRGRDFSWQDTAKTQPVTILNEKAARFLFPHGDAIDHNVVQGDRELRVVGIVSDIHETDVEAGSAWQMYFPVTQLSDMDGLEVVVRSAVEPSLLQASVMEALRRSDPGQPAAELHPLQTLVDHSTSPRRFFAVLVGCFAGTGLLLACLGLYGVVSYSVARQTQEIGIRMALGASRGSVLGGVLKRTLRLACIGIGVGTVASFAVARGIGSMLYGTEPTDPLTFAGMLILLLTVALLAGLLPARRAANVSPLLALRTE